MPAGDIEYRIEGDASWLFTIVLDPGEAVGAMVMMSPGIEMSTEMLGVSWAVCSAVSPARPSSCRSSSTPPMTSAPSA